MNIKRVGIIRGGALDYESSFKRGSEIILHILDNLSDKYRPVDMLIDRDGIWHSNGLPINSGDLTDKIDILWNTIHADPSINITHFLIPKVEISSFSSALKSSRDMLLEHLKTINVKMPRRIVLPLYQKDFDGLVEDYAINKAKEIFAKFSPPWIVKSLTPDISMGVHLAKTLGELVDAIKDGVKHQKSILVEEFISGDNVSVHSISKFRGENVYVFPPKDISKEKKEQLISLVKDLHYHLGVNHYLKSDFIFHPHNGFFLTDIDLFPDFKPGSHFSESCEYVGAKIYHIIDHMLDNTFVK